MEIILPPRAERPKFQCLTCGARFYSDQRRLYQSHAIECSQKHEDMERALSMRERLGAFGGGYVDEEYESWVSKRRRAIIDGSVKM